MREYIAKKEFYSGDIDSYIQKGERVQYDGMKLIIRGEEKKAPGLRAAIGVFLEAATTDARGKPIDAAPQQTETPKEKAERLKAERIAQVYGGTGNGVPFDDKKGQLVDKRQPRKDIELKQHTAKEAKKKLEIEKAANKTALKKTAYQNKPKLEVVSETEGVEVAKVKAGVVSENKDPRTFYETLLDGERKKLSVDKDSYVPQKRPVVVIEDQNEAVEIKRLTGADQITPSGNALKDWDKMTATKKHAFIKKQNDAEVLKKIAAEETGETKRKAVDKLNSLGR